MAEYIERSDAAVFFENSKQTMWHKDDIAATISSKKSIPAADVVEIPEGGIGELSDGYHTFNELYHHRAILFSVICNSMPDKAWKLKLHDTGDMFEGMFIVGIETPHGQATYHYDIEPYWEMFEVKELERAPMWDGHSPQDVINRISEILIKNDGIVRCKDCDYYDGYDCERLDLQLIDSDCYCSWAKKKAGEG